MAEYTQNFNLIKPGQEDFYNVENFNNNADIIDAELKKLENNKVDKVEGKQLSTEDYTTEEKQKLAGIEEGANKYTHPKTHSANIITENENRRFVSDVEKANWDSKETPEGAQAKANAAASSALAAANSYTDQEVGALAGEGNVKTVKQLDDDLAAHKAEKATQDGYGHIRLKDIPSPEIATKSEAETGTNNTKMMTPLRTSEALDSRINFLMMEQSEESK